MPKQVQVAYLVKRLFRAIVYPASGLMKPRYARRGARICSYLFGIRWAHALPIAPTDQVTETESSMATTSS
ncbi:MAG: hypothetical protein ACRECQ_15115, partial [Burkholderiaceae bacterium]